MARKEIVTVEFTDDIDGGKAEGTVTFGFDGKSYEIDLSKKNRAAFEKALKPYIEGARRATGRNESKARAGKRAAKRSDLQEIREWSKTQEGLPAVADRGRVPQVVIDAYDDAR